MIRARGAMVLTALLVFCQAAGAREPSLGSPQVAVLLRFEQPPGKGFFETLRREVDDIFRPAGLDLHWFRLDQQIPRRSFDRVVVVEMRGRCSVAVLDEVLQTPAGGVTLGSTAVEEGQVIPFSMLYCDLIARAVARMRGASLSRALLPSSYYRLAGRVMAHEMMHALLRSTGHQDTDCARAVVLPYELYAPARLTPAERAALRRLRADPSGISLAKGERLPAAVSGYRPK